MTICKIAHSLPIFWEVPLIRGTWGTFMGVIGLVKWLPGKYPMCLLLEELLRKLEENGLILHIVKTFCIWRKHSSDHKLLLKFFLIPIYLGCNKELKNVFFLHKILNIFFEKSKQKLLQNRLNCLENYILCNDYYKYSTVISNQLNHF